jgi:hypothetical protein
MRIASLVGEATVRHATAGSSVRLAHRRFAAQHAAVLEVDLEQLCALEATDERAAALEDDVADVVLDLHGAERFAARRRQRHELTTLAGDEHGVVGLVEGEARGHAAHFALLD